jgi:hypothetical protein
MRENLTSGLMQGELKKVKRGLAPSNEISVLYSTVNKFLSFADDKNMYSFPTKQS